jgi:hypothetical protein
MADVHQSSSVATLHRLRSGRLSAMEAELSGFFRRSEATALHIWEKYREDNKRLDTMPFCESDRCRPCCGQRVAALFVCLSTDPYP